MKRKLKWLAVVLAVVLLAGGVALFLSPRDRITHASWKEIRIGMTEKEVEGILGGPGISQDEYWSHIDNLERLGKAPQLDGKPILERDFETIGINQLQLFWMGRLGCINIVFDQGGHVILKVLYGWRPADPTFLERLRDWLGW